MKILITGIHGFVGTNLVRALSPHHTIYGLDIVSPPCAGVRRTYSWDELDAIPEVDAVIHLAAIVHIADLRDQDQSLTDTNVGLTRKILDYYNAHCEIDKFILFSSQSVFSDEKMLKSVVIDEDTPLSPSTPYGKSKAISERLASAEDFSTRKIYILRPAMIHGPGAKGNLPLLYSVIRRGIPWPLGRFENLRSMASVDNVTFIVNSLLTRDVDPGTYNVADDYPVSTNAIIRLINKSIGCRRARIWMLPKWLVRAVAKMGDGLHLPLDSTRLGKLTGNFVVSNEKIKSALGVDHLPVDAIEGLRRSLESFSQK